MTGPFSVLMPVGPGNSEISAAADTLESLRMYEPDAHVVLVDDNPMKRQKLSQLWPNPTIIRTALWEHPRRRPHPYAAMVAGTLDGLKECTGSDFVVKLDTDALVIAPFAEPVRRALAQDVGVVGTYERNPNGDHRDWTGWIPQLRRAALPVRVSKSRPYVRVLDLRTASTAWRVCRTARSSGAHCQGGAYAVGAALLNRVDLLDWRPWAHTGLSEDVVVGLLCQAAGLEMRGLSEPGDVFGVRWRGLPGSPEDLISQGYSIIHSLKNDERMSEEDIRSFFASRRRLNGTAPCTAGEAQWQSISQV